VQRSHNRQSNAKTNTQHNIRMSTEISISSSLIPYTYTGETVVIFPVNLIHDLFDLGEGHTNFTSLLLRLIMKADSNNIQKLALAFPLEVLLVSLWKSGAIPLELVHSWDQKPLTLIIQS